LALAAIMIAISSVATAGSRLGSVSDGWPGQRIITTGGLSDHSTWVTVMISAPVIRPVARTVVLLTVCRFLDGWDLAGFGAAHTGAAASAPLTCSSPQPEVGRWLPMLSPGQTVGVFGTGWPLTQHMGCAVGGHVPGLDRAVRSGAPPSVMAPSLMSPSVVAPGLTTLLICVMWSAF
jgi:hypothetical protein